MQACSRTVLEHTSLCTVKVGWLLKRISWTLPLAVQKDFRHTWIHMQCNSQCLCHWKHRPHVNATMETVRLRERGREGASAWANKHFSLQTHEAAQFQGQIRSACLCSFSAKTLKSLCLFRRPHLSSPSSTLQACTWAFFVKAYHSPFPWDTDLL